jgi:hypothetical protein
LDPSQPLLSDPPTTMLTRSQQLGLLIILFIFVVYVYVRVR